MRIAVSQYQNNVATAFDFAEEVAVFTAENGKVTGRQNLVLDDQFMPVRAMKLRELRINIVLCGAISNPSAAMLQHQGIEVMCGITGNVETVVQEFLKGNIHLPRYWLPGFSHRRCRKMQSARHKRGCRTRREK